MEPPTKTVSSRMEARLAQGVGGLVLLSCGPGGVGGVPDLMYRLECSWRNKFYKYLAAVEGVGGGERTLLSAYSVITWTSDDFSWPDTSLM